MCVICASAAGIRQPSESELLQMFLHNPQGAGYMRARGGKVEISKGFMSYAEFIHAVRYERFTDDDAVVYHFRISTQAGVIPQMTQPFPLTSDIAKCEMLDVSCPVGVAHNGIVRLTSDWSEKRYSDTAHFIAEFMCYLLRNKDDLRNPRILDAIQRMTDSKWAIMDGSGYIATVGNFINDDGLLFSNGTYQDVRYIDRGGSQRILRGFYDDAPEYDDDAAGADENTEPWAL